MKKIFIFIFALVAIIIIGILIMFSFSICPPKGPWPTPPWCGADFAINHYDVNIVPVKIGQIKAVNMYDTWGRNYNMGMVETTQANIDSSFDRVKRLGAQEIYVHDFDRAVYKGEHNYQSVDYELHDDIFGNDMRDEGISPEDLKKLVEAAHSRGMKIGIKRNLTFFDMKSLVVSGLSGNISQDVKAKFVEFNKNHSEAWVRDYFSKWQIRLTEKAKLYNKAGVDIMSVSPGFQEMQFVGQEKLANELWKSLLIEVKKNFSGQVLVDLDVYGLVDGRNGTEDWTKYDYYKNADIVEVKIYKILEKYQSKNRNAKDDIKKMLIDLNNQAKKTDIKLSVFFAPSSYENGLYNDPVEFLDIRNEKIKTLKSDYIVQSNAYDYFFRALADLDNIVRINAGNFAWDDALDPEVKARVSISASFRNKPAESVVEAWYKY